MTKEEIREKINSNYAIIQESLIKETFVLNSTVSGLLEENEELRKRCPHEFGEDGVCIYCDLEEKKNMKLYTIDCPACQVLEKKLDLKNLSYEKIYDEKIHDEKEIVNFPVLELDNGEILNFSEAVKWVNSKEVQI